MSPSSDDSTSVYSGGQGVDLQAHLTAYRDACVQRRATRQALTEKLTLSEISESLDISEERVGELAATLHGDEHTDEQHGSPFDEQTYERVVRAWLDAGGDAGQLPRIRGGAGVVNDEGGGGAEGSCTRA